MSEPFIGQIQPLGFNFPPKGWAQCDGQLLPISQNSALFSLLGTTFGGNGTATFGLPDLRGRVPVSQGNLNGVPYPMGTWGGAATVTLNSTQIPQHTHTLMGSTPPATSSQPTAGGTLATPALPGGTPNSFYGAATNLTALYSGSVGPAGNSQPHDNMQPYLAVNWCIALIGIYPSRN